MGGLSHGVIRVNTEDKNSALTVQDVGHVMPGGEDGGKQKYMKHERLTSNQCGPVASFQGPVFDKYLNTLDI